MATKLELFVGLLLYIFDLVFDILVCIQYWNNNESWWFWMTVVLIGVPSLLVKITAIFQLINGWRCTVGFLQLSIVVRYIEELASPDSSGYYSLAMLRYLETITESAPQLCLQLYIMLRQGFFPWYTVLSSVSSLLSLAWSITTLEKERANEERDFKPLHTTLFLIWQLFTLISRLSAIVLFAYVFRYYVIIFLAAHWLLLAVVILIIQRYDGTDSLGKSLFLSCLAGCPSLFHSSETVLPTRNPKVEMLVGYIFVVLENIIMLIVFLTIEMPDIPHMDVLKPVAMACVIGGGTFLSLIFIFIYYCCVDP